MGFALDFKRMRVGRYAAPKTMGPMIDDLYAMQEARRALSAMEAEIKALETECKDRLLTKYGQARIEGAAGKTGQARVEKKTVPQAKSWPRLWAYMRKTGDFDLVQKRLNGAAVQERWDANQAVPGVEPFRLVVVRVGKK